jgi:hypothetical protein
MVATVSSSAPLSGLSRCRLWRRSGGARIDRGYVTMVMVGVACLATMVFSGLAPLAVEDVADEGDRIRVLARTPDAPAAHPWCGVRTSLVHGYR